MCMYLTCIKADQGLVRYSLVLQCRVAANTYVSLAMLAAGIHTTEIWLQTVGDVLPCESCQRITWMLSSLGARCIQQVQVGHLIQVVGNDVTSPAVLGTHTANALIAVIIQLIPELLGCLYMLLKCEGLW